MSGHEIPKPNDGEFLDFVIIKPKARWCVWWGIYDDTDDADWVDGGFVSSHRSHQMALIKLRELRHWHAARMGHPPRSLDHNPPRLLPDEFAKGAPAALAGLCSLALQGAPQTGEVPPGLDVAEITRGKLARKVPA